MNGYWQRIVTFCFLARARMLWLRPSALKNVLCAGGVRTQSDVLALITGRARGSADRCKWALGTGRMSTEEGEQWVLVPLC